MHLNGYESKCKERAHYKRLDDMCLRYPSPVYEKDWSGSTFNAVTPYYKRMYKSSGKSSGYAFHKKQSNRVMRKHKKDCQNGNHYRKQYDLWWNWL